MDNKLESKKKFATKVSQQEVSVQGVRKHHKDFSISICSAKLSRAIFSRRQGSALENYVTSVRNTSRSPTEDVE